MEPSSCIKLLERILTFITNYTARRVKMYRPTVEFLLKVKAICSKIITRVDNCLEESGSDSQFTDTSLEDVECLTSANLSADLKGLLAQLTSDVNTLKSQVSSWNMKMNSKEDFSINDASQEELIDEDTYINSNMEAVVYTVSSNTKKPEYIQPDKRFNNQLYYVLKNSRLNKSGLYTVDTTFKLIRNWYTCKFSYPKTDTHCPASFNKIVSYMKAIVAGAGNAISEDTFHEYLNEFNNWLPQSGGYPLPVNVFNLVDTEDPYDLKPSGHYLWQALIDTYFSDLVKWGSKSETPEIYPDRFSVLTWMIDLADGANVRRQYMKLFSGPEYQSEGNIEKYLTLRSVSNKFNELDEDEVEEL